MPHPARRLSLVMLVAAAAMSALGGPARSQVADPAGPVRLAERDGRTTSSLRSRVAPPHEDVIAAYREAGATGATAHEITDAEWALVERAIADLPPLHRRILEQRLARLSFIDAPDSAGTALTRSFEGPDGQTLFDITLRADALDKTLTEFLTSKEQMLFSDDGSGFTVHVHAGDVPALPYLLMHEAAHVVDRALAISTERRPFADLWSDYRTLSEPWAAAPIGVSAYRRGPQLPLAQSTALYRALAASPFVSLYGTASAGEDLAELSAWNVLSTRFGVTLVIEVRDARGRTVLHIEPLASPAVKARLASLETLIARLSSESRPDA